MAACLTAEIAFLPQKENLLNLCVSNQRIVTVIVNWNDGPFTAHVTTTTKILFALCNLVMTLKISCAHDWIWFFVSDQWPLSYFGDQWMGYYKITMSWDSLQRQSSIWHEPFCRFKGQCDARAKFVQVQPYLQKGCPPIILHMDNIGFNYRCVSLMHSSYDVI